MLLPARWNQAAALMRVRLRSVRLTARGTALLLVSLASLIGAYGIGLPELLYLGAFTLALPLAAIASVVLRRVDLRVSRDFAPATVERANSRRSYDIIPVKLENLAEQQRIADTYHAAKLIPKALKINDITVWTPKP